MKISVIIPTYNGAMKVVNCLAALESQSFKDFEVIVVIDGSVDNTSEILRDKEYNFKNFKVVAQENKGRSVSRNEGARKAGGELFVFFDDDMRPTFDCLEFHFKHHLDYKESILVGSQFEDLKLVKSDIQRYKANLSRKWSAPIAGLKKPLNKSQIFLSSANFSIPSKLFFSLNGFDERLTDAEDFDLGVRAYLKNIPIYYNEKVLAYHDDLITCRSYIKRLTQYKVAHQKLMELKPILYKDFSQHQAQIPGLHKMIIYKILKNSFWLNLIENEKLKNILPEKYRYKLYDIIITAHII